MLLQSRFILSTVLTMVPALTAMSAQAQAPAEMPIEEADVAVEWDDAEAPGSLQDASDEAIEELVENALERRQDDMREDGILLTLEEAKARAIENNPSLHAAAARIDQARQRVIQARSLYFPQISAAYTASHTRLPESTVGPARDEILRGTLFGALNSLSSFFLFGSGGAPATQTLLRTGQSVVDGLEARNAIDDSIENYELSLTASYILFDGFARRFQLLAARYGEQEIEAARAEGQRLLLNGVATAYFGVQLARENIAIARANEAFNERLLKEANARRRVGTGSLSDVLNFEVQLRIARNELLEAQRQYEFSRISLASLMGIEGAQLPEDTLVAGLAPESAEEMGPANDDERIQYALAHRPDVQQARLAVERRDAGVKIERSAYYPRVNAFAAKSATRNNNSRFRDDDFAGTVGVTVNYDLFTGGRNRATVREARYAKVEAEYGRQAIELDAAAEVRQALVDLRVVQEQVILQQATAEYVERNRDLVKREYDAGQGALALLNQAQRDLIQAQARLALARVSLRQAWQLLETATGEILAPFSVVQEAAPEAP